MNPIVQLIIEEAPSIVSLVQGLLKKKDPGAPVPTAQEILDGFEQAFTDSNAKDEILKVALQAEIDAAKGTGNA